MRQSATFAGRGAQLNTERYNMHDKSATPPARLPVCPCANWRPLLLISANKIVLEYHPGLLVPVLECRTYVPSAPNASCDVLTWVLRIESRNIRKHLVAHYGASLVGEAPAPNMLVWVNMAANTLRVVYAAGRQLSAPAPSSLEKGGVA